MSAKETALMDLNCLKRIVLSCKECQSFNSMHTYSFLRDVCLVLEEIQNAFDLKKEIVVDRNIKKIRQNVKLFGQRNKLSNQGMYEKIRKIHEENFAKWENNIGFYITNGEIKGSTLYSTYMFYDSEFENPYQMMYDSIFKEKFKAFSSKAIPLAIERLEGLLYEEGTTEPKTVEIIEVDNSIAAKGFDVRAELFFYDEKNSLSYQTMIFRLLLSLQELNYIIYIYRNFIDQDTRTFADEYYFVRVLTKGADTVMKNINNIARYQPEELHKWIKLIEDKTLRLTVENIANTQSLVDWTKEMRDMIHYKTDTDNPQMNFLGYFKENQMRVTKESYLFYEDVVLPLQEAITQVILPRREDQYSLTKMVALKMKHLFIKG